MSSLTEEQVKRMEENKKLALAKRAAKQRSMASVGTAIPVKPPCVPANVRTGVNTYQKYGPKEFIGHTQPKLDVSSQHALQSQPYSKIHNFKSPGISKNTNLPTAKSPTKFYGEVKKGVLALISKERFALDMEYHQPTIDVVKAIDGRQYDPNKKQWHFPMSQYNKVLEALRSLRPHVAITELPKLVVDTFQNRGQGIQPSEVDLSSIQRGLLATLMEFQKDGVRFAVSKCGRVLIADDMGLGKTIQALAIADYYRKDWPLLIVCPSSMRYQWREEIEKHLPNVQSKSIYVLTTGKEKIENSISVLITSYDLMTSQKARLLEKGFNVVIMDESHHLKNLKTARTKTGLELLKNSRRCVLLSGTPVLSRPMELFSQLQGIKPSLFSSKTYMEFGIRYCEGKKERFGWNFSGSSNMVELGLLLSELLMIRRLKTDVLSQLPPKRREVVVLESDGKKLSDTSEFAKHLQKEGLKGMEKRSTMLQYFSETGKCKIKGISQYVQDMIENGEKFLVFAHHAPVLDAICEAVERKKTDYIRIDGSVPSDVRKLLCNSFQTDKNCMVAVLSIKAANTGLTLTAARLVIFAELYWNPGELTQAEDRVHRIGQEDSVLVQYLVQHNTADDLMWPLIQSKLDVLNKAGLSKDNFKEADTHTLQGKQKDVLEYFNTGIDDAEFADINFEELENGATDGPGPEKKPRTC